MGNSAFRKAVGVDGTDGQNATFGEVPLPADADMAFSYTYGISPSGSYPDSGGELNNGSIGFASAPTTTPYFLFLHDSRLGFTRAVNPPSTWLPSTVTDYVVMWNPGDGRVILDFGAAVLPARLVSFHPGNQGAGVYFPGNYRMRSSSASDMSADLATLVDTRGYGQAAVNTNMNNTTLCIVYRVPAGAVARRYWDLTFSNTVGQWMGASEILAFSAEEDRSAESSRTVVLKALDDATVLTTGDGKTSFPIPDNLNGLNLIDADALVAGGSSSGLPTIQLRRVRGGSPADMLTTKITIDVGETDSYSAATPAVIDPSNNDVVTGDRIYVDVDVAGTGTDGLDVALTFG